MHRVEQTKRFRHARDEEALGILVREEAGDIDLPEVERRLAMHDPVREREPGAPARLDADRVEAGGDEEVLQVWRWPEHVTAIDGEAFRPIEELADADLAETGDAPQRVIQDRREMLVVFGQFAESEVFRNAIDGPRLGDRLKRTDEKLAGIFLVISAVI